MSDAPGERHADWRVIYQLLQSGAYEQLADMLHDLQLAGETTADRVDAGAIAAVREICLACRQCQAEVELHRQAGEAAERREQQLKNHAQTMLDWVRARALFDLVQRGPMTEPHPAEALKSVRESRLSLNARNLLQRAKHLFMPELTTSATPLAQEIEGPALTEREPGKTQDLHVEKEEAKAEPPLPASIEAPETPIVAAPPGELGPITPHSTEVADEALEPPLPAGIEAPETPIVAAPPGELAPITPLSTEVVNEALELPLPASIEAPETPIVAAPPGELVPITPLGPEVADEEPEPPFPAGIGEPETPLVSVLPATAQRAPESYIMAIYCFGPFRVYQHRQPIEAWNSLRGQAVLKYLVAHRGTPTAKDVLMDVFWPNADPEAARRNLHQAIYSLRQTLRRRDPDIQHIQFENNQYLLNPALSCTLHLTDYSKKASGQYFRETRYQEPHTGSSKSQAIALDLKEYSIRILTTSCLLIYDAWGIPAIFYAIRYNRALLPEIIGSRSATTTGYLPQCTLA